MGVLRTCSSHGGQSKAILGGNLEADIENQNTAPVARVTKQKKEQGQRLKSDLSWVWCVWGNVEDSVAGM